MSNVITWLIIGLLVCCLFVGVMVAAKKMARVIAIFLPLVLIVFVVRLFFTRENLDKIHDGVEQTGIGDVVERTVLGASGKKSSDGDTKELKTGTLSLPADARSVENAAPTTIIASGASKTAEVVMPDAGVVAEAAKPTEMAAIDYSKYDKGRKAFTYALPFSAKVVMSFKEGNYRIIVESLGELSASDKKEIGRLMLKSLSAYRGEDVSSIDKSKVSIDVKHDAESNHTKVSMNVPLDALES